MEGFAAVTESVEISVDLSKPARFTGRSVEAGQPVSVPIKTLEDLFAWKANDDSDCGQLFNVASVPHLAKAIPAGSPRTLLCHDMKGGYLEDRFVQGVESKSHVAYYMIYWSGVDVFVYFSHNFVTIPPVGWVNACHRNGVTVLGTFITEWDEGRNRCKAILSTPALWKATADRLVEVAKFYGFDGWLVNVENAIEESQVESLVNFVKYLKEAMHRLDENALVIWYDSVTRKGSLDWQNALNEENRCFFDACDGIFLNYNWSEEDLDSSKQLSADPSRVYVGIDTFGRGCYGGGGFNSCQALSVIRRVGLSAAIFAPGWVHEVLGPENFASENKRFWTLLHDLTERHPMRVDRRLSTAFRSGFGPKRDQHGYRGNHWYCVNAQETMPVLTTDNVELCRENQDYRLHVKGERSAQKSRHPRGSRFDPIVKEEKEDRLVPLFNVHLHVSSGSVTVGVKGSCFCVLVLETDSGRLAVNLHSDSKRNMLVGEISHPTPFTIDGIALKEATHALDIEYLEIDITDPSLTTPLSPMQLSHIDWGVDVSDKKVFKLGCTLLFDPIPPCTNVSTISYRCLARKDESEGQESGSDPDPVFIELGSAYTNRYRVHDLLVPNPKFCGPDRLVEFQVRHLTTDSQVIGVRNMKVVYAENT